LISYGVIIMTATKDERLSALMDGEATEFETRRLVDELLANQEDRSRWARTHLIGDAMRGELPERMPLDFAASVRAQIELEPALHMKAGLSASHWVKPTAGFAVAAMVAVVSVLSLQSMVGYDQSPVQDTQLSASTPQPVSPVESNFRLASAPATEAVKAGVSSEEVQQRINRYLVNHSEYATHPGVLPYARIVGYEKSAQ
jgi:sigma-E factor negative regulatory protein RseA